MIRKLLLASAFCTFFLAGADSAKSKDEVSVFLRGNPVQVIHELQALGFTNEEVAELVVEKLHNESTEISLVMWIKKNRIKVSIGVATATMILVCWKMGVFGKIKSWVIQSDAPTPNQTQPNQSSQSEQQGVHQQSQVPSQSGEQGQSQVPAQPQIAGLPQPNLPSVNDIIEMRRRAESAYQGYRASQGLATSDVDRRLNFSDASTPNQFQLNQPSQLEQQNVQHLVQEGQQQQDQVHASSQRQTLQSHQLRLQELAAGLHAQIQREESSTLTSESLVQSATSILEEQLAS